MDSDPSSSRHGAAAAVVFVPQHIAEPSTSAMTLQPPGEPAGVFFSLSSSQPESIHPSSSSLPSSRPSPASGAGAATASREPRRIAKAPSSRSRPRLRHPHLSNADDFSSSSKARAPPLYTVDNSLKVDLSVCARPPQPADAPPVTLAVYCDPHPSTVDLTPFAVAAAEVERREKSKETKSRTGGPAAKGRTNGTSTTSTTGRTTPTPASSRYTPAASVSTSSTHPSSPGLLSEPPDLSTSVSSLSISTPASPATTPLVAASTTPKRPAWATPKSWAELAARGSSGLPATASSLHSGVSCAGGDVSLPSDSTPTSPSAVTSPRPQANGARSGILPPAKKPAPVGLDALLADAHTRFNAPLTHPRGLVNNGNFCFANAILQVLVYCAPFYNLFTTIAREVPHDFGNHTPLMDAVIHFLREFHTVERSSSSVNGRVADPGAEAAALSEAFLPEFVYDAMRLNKRFDAMRRGHQEDAEEFLGFFLDTLHEELLSALRRSANKLGGLKLSAAEKRLNGISDADLAAAGLDEEAEEREVTRPVSPNDGGWMEVGQKGKTSFTRTTSTSDSPITRIFGGKLRSVLRCPGAKDSVTLEPYQPLQLDIAPDHVHRIEDALLNLTIPETIHGVWSPSRNAPVDATKQVFVETLPPVLVLHLKRFVYDEVGGTLKSSKPVGYGTTLEIRPEMLSPARRSEPRPVYKLFGAVYHHGRYATGGHYTVDVLRQDGTEWIHIDDTAFHTIPPEHVVRDVGTTGAPSNAWGPAGHDGLAYLLFYRREDVEGLEANGVGTGAGAGAEKEKKKEKMEKREQKGREKEQKGTGSVKSGRR